MKIAIITDGNNELGMGHIYQSLTLANLLSDRIDLNSEIYFITKSGPNVLEQINKSGYRVYLFANDDLIFDYLKNENPDRIIFDKLDVSPNLASRIKDNIECKLVIFTNLTSANKYADIIVFARIGNNFKEKRILHNQATQVEFVGPKFWILRPEFYALKKLNKIVKNDIINIMLMFGGADPKNLSSLVLNEILLIDEKFNIQLILGSSFVHKKELEDILHDNRNSRSDVHILENIANIGEIMYESDLVITSPGLSFFESLVVGTPVIVFHQNIGHIEEFGQIIPTLDIEDIHKLPLLIKNKAFLFPNDPIISTMEIGEGKDEILTEILN